MPTTPAPKTPPEKPGPGGSGTGTDTAKAGTSSKAVGGTKGGVKPQDDDRPPQN